MKKQETEFIIPDEVVMNKIYLIRGAKVILDSDLADLYQVETKALKQAVKRNFDIFPSHFMFELTDDEYASLRSQTVTSKKRGGTRYLPMVFTEYGVLQLANVLRSERAKQTSIRIIEIFVKLRQTIVESIQLRTAIDKLEKKTDNNTKNIELVFQYVDELLEKSEPQKPRKQIGYKLPQTKD